MKLALPTLTLLALALALVGCTGERPGDTDTTPVVTAPADQPVADVPPATAPPSPAPQPTPPATGLMPAAGAISFDGFGPAKFGDDAEAVRMAWGKDLKAEAPAEPGGCHYLFPQPRPQGGYGIGFMIEGDKFARIDVDSADVVAPGGGKRGMTADEIRKLYAGGVEEQNHKYVEGGKVLRIKDAASGSGVLIFEADAAGKVNDWRIGVPPQVDYVEACS